METLFTISLLELFLGGGGRLLEIGPGTLRMLLFAVCLCASVVVALTRPSRTDGMGLALVLIVAYLLVHLSALLHGAVKGNDTEAMFQEAQQSLYWLAAPFMALALRSHKMVLRAATLVRVAGVAMALAYVAVVAGLALGLVDYLSLYATLDATGEFSFRSESFFFYKGFLYLCIAAVFFMAVPIRLGWLWGFVVVAAIVMTLTRGFVLSTAFAALLLLLAQRRWRLLGVVSVAVALVMFLMFSYLPSGDDALATSRGESNSQRVDDFLYIADNFRVTSLLIGEGLGTLINGRLNIENTFLWAAWRLGLAGVLFWLTPLVLCSYFFRHIGRRDPNYRLACAFFFSTVLVYVQTLSNPYLNNPIGLSFVLVALFSLRTLSRPQTAGTHAALCEDRAAAMPRATPAG